MLADGALVSQALPQDGNTTRPEHKIPEGSPANEGISKSVETSSATAKPQVAAGGPGDPAQSRSASDGVNSPAAGAESVGNGDGTESHEEHSAGHPEHTAGNGDGTDSSADPAVANPPPEVLKKKPQQLVLKPGQRIKIEGYAEGKEVEVIDGADVNKEPEFHRVYMRLSGSMCYSCLHTFEERLKQVFGIERVKLAKGTQVTVQQFSPDLSNWADATIYYDARRVSLTDIRAFSKNNGYVSYRVLDKLADSIPPEEMPKSPWSKK